MTFKEIQSLLKLVSDSDLSEVRIKEGDFELTVRTGSYSKTKVTAGPTMMTAAPMANMVAAPAAIQQAAPQAAANTGAPVAEEAETSNLLEIKSPIVGTFYRSSAPDKPVFTKVGESVKEGSVVCIIEAMKLFNEIESEVSGKIVKVLVDDATPVEYDQVLFLVDPNG